MKKHFLPLTLIALTAIAMPALSNAQTNLTVYGWVDLGYTKETGKYWRLAENDSNALGFKGTEDLGGGLKATFDLQTRFTLNDGMLESSENSYWEGNSNVGLAGDWGQVRFGRMNEVPTETFRVLDPFDQNGPASMLRSSQRSVRISNTARYDSPVWNGLHLRASYSLGENTNKDSGGSAPGSAGAAGADNDGYALSLRYDRGPLFVLGSWSRRADSNDSSMWNVGTAYQLGPVRLSIGYENTRDKGWKNGEYSNSSLAAQFGGTQGVSVKQDSWIAGLQWKIGVGTINALFNYVKLKDGKIDGTATRLSDEEAYKYALGYTYDLSKRTQLYTMVSYTDYDSKTIASYYRGVPPGGDSITSLQLGIIHKF